MKSLLNIPARFNIDNPTYRKISKLRKALGNVSESDAYRFIISNFFNQYPEDTNIIEIITNNKTNDNETVHAGANTGQTVSL